MSKSVQHVCNGLNGLKNILSRNIVKPDKVKSVKLKCWKSSSVCHVPAKLLLTLI